MIGALEQSLERDAALAAMLSQVAAHGWTQAALVAAGIAPLEAELLFPGGTGGLLEAWSDMCDRGMAAAAIARGVADQRVSARVRTLVLLRLAELAPYRAAARRAAGLLVLPQNIPTATRCTARTVDAIWHAAGDISADFSWYSKRAILGAVWTATRLFWLADTSEGQLATETFLDRRLAGVAQIGKLRGRLQTMASRRPFAAAG